MNMNAHVQLYVIGVVTNAALCVYFTPVSWCCHGLCLSQVGKILTDSSVVDTRLSMVVTLV